MRRAVVNLRDARPAWRIPAWAEARIAAAFGPGWTVHVVESAADGRGDGQCHGADEDARHEGGAGQAARAVQKGAKHGGRGKEEGSEGQSMRPSLEPMQ